MRVLATTLLILTIVVGCSSTEPRERGQRVDVNLLTRAQLEPFDTSSAYDAVEALRGTWLRTRGRTSLRVAGEVTVYLDGTRLGGINTLRSIPTEGVSSIRYYDGVEAGARFGLDHGHGVIYVSTRL
jgi:hypothetical protein